MGLGPVIHEDWRDETPSDAKLLSCRQEVHHTQDEPAPDSVEICGTPYTVDTGSGYGEVAQDCEYEVYADWCKYEVQEWGKVDEVTLSGSDPNPRWPSLQLAADQREGERSESYAVVFDADEKDYTYQTRDPEEFSQLQIGSRWILKVNRLDSVVSVEPAR